MDEATIENINARGEGVTADGRVAPGALPGERVAFPSPACGRTQPEGPDEGSLADAPVAERPHPGPLPRAGVGERQAEEGANLLSLSPERAAPICRYFGACGGCAAQHMGPRLYREWKRGLLMTALKRTGVDAEVSNLVDVHGEGRRRATFHARFLPHARDEVGFMRARAHEIVEIDDCPLFSPGMAGALGAARALAGDLRGLGKPLDIQATATLGGLDFDVRGAGALGASELKKLVRTADAHDLARVSNHGRTVVERRPPEIAIGGARVTAPAGGFLQATEAGEAAMAALASEALAGARRVADLFCGVGAFALRLAEGHEVWAADVDKAAVEALRRASTRGTRPIIAETRDLFQRPLSAEELDNFDGAVFDPPRAGALAQSKEFAKSRLAVVVAVSCSAETFARDARLLIDGGFALERVTPLDQFRYSPHVEIVAVFRRPREKRRRKGVFG